jgi:Ferritin-like
MSYLGLPRLHFAGRFLADVATVNNNPAYYDIDRFQPRFQRLPGGDQENGSFNPRGGNSFRLSECVITGGLLADGTAPGTDPVVGGRVAGDDRRVSGKVVDLDPEFQATALWGLRLRLLDRDGRLAGQGDFTPTGVNDPWRRTIGATGAGGIGGWYQSVLTDLDWADDIMSPLLTELRTAGALSVKFNVDGYVLDRTSPQFGSGRIAGTIGRHEEGDTKHFVAGRRLRQQPNSPLSPAPCRLDEDRAILFVDLGNSIRTTAQGGPLEQVGPLQLAVLDTAGPRVIAPLLAGIDDGFYPARAGIAQVQLSAEQAAEVAESRIGVVSGQTVLLAENADASYVVTEQNQFRLYPQAPHDTASTTLVGTKFGRPAAGMQVMVMGPPPSSPLTVPSQLNTDANGRAVLTLQARDPGSPRRGIDGQLFIVGYAPAGATAPEAPIGVLVQQLQPDVPQPAWVTDVAPIFQQYANLFPVMRDVFDLSNYHHVVTYRDRVRASLTASPLSPGHMPVSRDLSPGKRDMVVRWLDTGPVPPMLQIDTVEELRRVLQIALELEHATIPAYLAALYSIKPDRNIEVAEIIRGVVREEMLHMALVGNILNAIGGSPRIGRPGFVPVYPAHLPGGVLPNLVVTLRKCSPEHVRDVFMAIEQPDYPTVDGSLYTGAVIDRARFDVDAAGNLLDCDDEEYSRLEKWFVAAEYTPFTIGWFYNQIATAIVRLSRGGTLFTGDPARQVSWPKAPGTLYRVTDRRTALLAVHEIIEQGEGSPHDLDNDNIADPDEFGHYYRFREIVEGHRLIKDRRGKWVYEGPDVPFDPDGVFPVADDADTYSLPPNTRVRRQSLLCDEVYGNLLASLHDVFNGRPEQLDDTIGLMFSVQVEAKRLLDMPTAPGAPTVAGPAFQVP